MKKIVVLLIFILACRVLSQDTNIVKYLPLKVGNVWVYSLNTYARAKLRVTGTAVSNNHVYYNVSQQGYIFPCVPTGQCMSPLLDSLTPIRIDSVSGNVMRLGSPCSWYSNENIMDSLKMRIGGSPNDVCVRTLITDTGYQNIFGTQRKVKFMVFNAPPPYAFGRRYAYGIGIVNSSQDCEFNYSCNYSLLGCVIDGVVYGDTTYLIGIVPVSSEVPELFSLSQNYPNPFNPKTVIRFQVASGKFISLKIFDALGSEIETLVSQMLKPGTYEVDWDGTNYPSGVYFYQLSTDEKLIAAKKMLMVK